MKKRIAFINPCSDLSGAEMSLLLLLSGLDQQRYELVLIAPEEGPLTRKARAIGIEVRSFPMHAMMIEKDVIASLQDALASLRQLQSIRGLLTETKPDLVHVNSYRVGIPFSLVARRLGIPSVWHLRDIPQSALKRRMLAQLVRLPTKVIAISNAVARSVVTADASNLVVVYNGVNLGLFEGATPGTLRNELNIAEGTAIFGTIGQLIPWKGQDLLIRAFASLRRDRHLSMRLVIVGDTIKPIWSVTNEYLTYPEHLKQLVSDYSLEEHVQFIGFRNDIPQVLADFDCLVHTPRAPEPFGRVVVEAMAAAKPVIAPRQGGILEIVDDGITGLLFESEDLDSLTNSLAYAVDNETLMRQMGLRGSERARKRFSAQAHVAKIDKLYAQLLSSKHDV